ncbi:hypothetical protein BDF21DRAFT_419435 [Thamnidium elegans]|nr:hypothetical protein BDF21DRAFT_419435 [Thamnidium elegans]
MLSLLLVSFLSQFNDVRTNQFTDKCRAFSQPPRTVSIKRKTDMEWAKEPVDQYKKENRKMSWKKNHQSLKSTYHSWMNNQK